MMFAANLHIIIAIFNIDVCDLLDKKVDHFKEGGYVPEDVAHVHYDYH